MRTVYPRQVTPQRLLPDAFMSKPHFQLATKDLVLIAVLFCIAFALRLIYLFQYSHTSIFPVFTYSDSYYYYIWGRDIASGDFIGREAFMKWPLYAYFIGALFTLSGSSIISVYLLQFFLGAVNCVLVYFIGQQVFNRAAGFIAGLLCAVYGLFIFYDGLLMYSSLSLFLNFCLFLFTLRIQHEPNKKNLFFLGILLGVCTLTQANMVFYGVLAVAWMLRKKKCSLRDAVLPVSSFILGLAIVVGSVTIRNYLVEKDLVLLSGNIGLSFYLGNSEKATGTFFSPVELTLNQEDMFRDARIIAEAKAGRALKSSEVSRFWVLKAAAFIGSQPLQYLRLLCKKLFYHFGVKEFVHDIEFNLLNNKIPVFKLLLMDLRIVLPFCFLGMALAFRKRKETALCYFAIISVTVISVIFFVSSRYRLAIVPFFMLFAGFAAWSVWEALKERKFRSFSTLAVSLLILYPALNYVSILSWRENRMPLDKDAAINYYVTRAIGYENALDYREALKEYEHAYGIAPDNKRVLFRLGVIHFRMNNLMAAEAYFKEVAGMNEHCVDAYFNLGVIYNRQQRFQEAIEMLKKAVAFDQKDAKTHFHLGLAYKSAGFTLEAKQEFSDALRKISRWRNEERKLILGELDSLSR